LASGQVVCQIPARHFSDWGMRLFQVVCAAYVAE
jgi:hypothetical protein